jgi:NAD(P)-dependent dehydrogenase (short-subunit alcohol dehydrogenase family)
MLAARREAELVHACDEARAAGGEARYRVTDVASETEVTALVDETLKHYGRIDILVNNAGYGSFRSLADTTSEEMRRIMDVNYFGTFYATRAVLPVMKK